MPILQFKGKSTIRSHHLTVPFSQLELQKGKSRNKKPNLSDNLIIQGDNLLALKALMPSFGGRVKCIFIDPPYNTGNESWVYNDNVNSPMHQEWLKKEVVWDDLTRHDKWLCMMWPRLQLLKDLLRPDGAIFVAIDDNEVNHLRLIMDEIFQPSNYVATFVWQAKDTPGNDSKEVASTHNYILCYKASDEFEMSLVPRTEKQIANYRNPDGDPRGPWLAVPLTRGEFRERDYYPLINPAGKEVLPPPGNSWRRPPETIQNYQKNGRLWWGKDGDSKFPFSKAYLSEVKAGVVPITWWDYKFAGSTRRARAEMKEIFAGERGFDTVKPVMLIRRVLELATEADAGDIVLDSCAGSGTTAHAVLAANAADGGNRRFILIEQEDYANSLTAERVRRVMQGIKQSSDDVLAKGYGGTFSYFTLGAAIDEEELLRGGKLPSYLDLARYVFFTATGEKLDDGRVDQKRWYIGENWQYELYLIYQPTLDFLKNTPLNLSLADGLGPPGDKPRLVIGSHKYLDDDNLRKYRIEFCQLPFAIYRFRS